MKEAHKTHPKTRTRKARHTRIRARISGTQARPRLSVFRSNTSVCAQIIDDSTGKTLAAVSDMKMEIKEAGDRSGKVARAYAAGKSLAEKAQELKISTVVFDRGGYAYHGRVKALAEGARDGGLIF